MRDEQNDDEDGRETSDAEMKNENTLDAGVKLQVVKQRRTKRVTDVEGSGYPSEVFCCVWLDAMVMPMVTRVTRCEQIEPGCPARKLCSRDEFA